MSQQWRTQRPANDEHAPFYAGYIAEAPDGDLVDNMTAQGTRIAQMFRAIPESRGGHRYAEGKWSIKDVVQHLCDAERIFSYRLLRFARADETNLPGFDEGIYAQQAGADGRTVADLAEEFSAVRRATIALITPLDDVAMSRRGTANNTPASARALAWIMVGHTEHHARILRERYL
jgi:uncharacterized damage-inducible protein DinB